MKDDTDEQGSEGADTQQFGVDVRFANMNICTNTWNEGLAQQSVKKEDVQNQDPFEKVQDTQQNPFNHESTPNSGLKQEIMQKTSQQNDVQGVAEPRRLLVTRKDISWLPNMYIALQTDHERFEYGVSSHLLCRASSVFRVMIGPDSQFREGAQLRSALANGNKKPFVLDLIEDDAKAFYVILEVIHYKNKHLRELTDFETLVQVAVLADKYDLCESILFTARAWIEKWHRWTRRPGYEASILIAFVFRERNMFAAIVEKYLNQGEINATEETPEASLVVNQEPLHQCLPSRVIGGYFYIPVTSY